MSSNSSYTQHWSQHGKVYLWEYKPNTAPIGGIQWSFNEAGKSSILDLLEFLAQQAYPTYRHVELSTPTTDELRGPNFGYEVTSKEKLKIALSDTCKVLSLDNKYEIYLTHEKLIELKEVISQSESGREVGIDIGEASIHFWWCME